MPKTRNTRLLWASALTAVACVATACSTSSSPDPAAAAPVVLRIGVSDDAQAPSAGQITHFADEVATQTHGTVKIEPVWQAQGEGTPHWDQAVAKMVVGGKLDLGLIPSRAWDDLGVTSLRALNTPFLITTDTLTAKVVSDAGLTRQLTAGLPAAGVTALGLFPEGLRHPFGFDKPLRGAADYRGGLVRMAWSRTENAMFDALGARTTDDDPDATMVGGESSYRLSPAGTATGNVVFFPKVNVLTARSNLKDQLTADQWAQLQAAATATGQWVATNLPTDQKSAQTFCSQAGKIAGASPAEIGSLVTATRSVVAGLRQDPATAAIIDAVTTMKKTDPEPVRVTSCAAPAAPDTTVNGTYAFTVTPEQARTAGVTDQTVLEENTGDFVWTFANGDWNLDQVYATGSKAGTKDHVSGGYTLSAGHLKIFWTHDPGGWTEVGVTRKDDGSLSFSNVHDGGDQQAQALAEAWFTTWKRA